MKKSLLIILLITGMSFTACKKILEVDPQNQVAASDVLKDINGYQSLLISVYDRLQSYTFYGRDMALMGDALADNIFTVSALNTRYQAQNLNSAGANLNIWTQAYGAILDLNTIIAGIDNVPVVGATQTQLRVQIKAEAYSLRGLMYFDIARTYGYEPNKVPTTGASAGFNKSAVIRLTPTLVAADTTRKNRSTIVETYNVIESDLKQAITVYNQLYLLPAFANNASRRPAVPYRFTESATHALLGKVYLYWERYADAVTQFNAALDATITAQTLVPITAGGYNAAFKKIPNPESLLELYYVQSVEVTGVTGSNDAPFTYTQPSGYNAANVSTFASQTPSAELLALFEAVDDRKAMFFTSRTSASTTVYNWCNKYTGTGGAFTDNIYMIRYSDVILMKAEALANQGLYTDAQTLVRQIRTARGITTANSTVVVPADATLLSFIQDERRRELFFEGHRWFDLKRLGGGITKPSATGVGIIPSTDYRILAGLPSAEVLLNPALPKNPGY